MNGRRWFGLALGMMVAIAWMGLYAQAGGEKKKGEKVTLAWKALAGKTPFFQTVVTTTKQDMTVQGARVLQDQEQTFWFEWTPEEKDGKYIVKQKILGVKMNINIGGNKMEYDSTKEAQPKNPMTDFFKQLIGHEFILTIKKDTLEVEKVEKVDDLVTKLSNVNKAMVPFLKVILNEKAIKQMASPMLDIKGEYELEKAQAVPEAKLDLGPLGMYTTNNKYTVTKASDKQATLGVEVNLNYAPLSKEDAAKQKDAKLPFEIHHDSVLKSKESKGDVVFNIDKGRVESADIMVKLEGTVRIKVSNQDVAVELKQEQKTKVTTSETNPLK